MVASSASFADDEEDDDSILMNLDQHIQVRGYDLSETAAGEGKERQ